MKLLQRRCVDFLPPPSPPICPLVALVPHIFPFLALQALFLYAIISLELKLSYALPQFHEALEFELALPLSVAQSTALSRSAVFESSPLLFFSVLFVGTLREAFQPIGKR